MFVDAREIDNDKLIQCDLCIIGAGAAGISLAREFDGSGISVCCLDVADDVVWSDGAGES